MFESIIVCNPLPPFLRNSSNMCLIPFIHVLKENKQDPNGALSQCTAQRVKFHFSEIVTVWKKLLNLRPAFLNFVMNLGENHTGLLLLVFRGDPTGWRHSFYLTLFPVSENIFNLSIWTNQYTLVKHLTQSGKKCEFLPFRLLSFQKQIVYHFSEVETMGTLENVGKGGNEHVNSQGRCSSITSSSILNY